MAANAASIYKAEQKKESTKDVNTTQMLRQAMREAEVAKAAELEQRALCSAAIKEKEAAVADFNILQRKVKAELEACEATTAAAVTEKKEAVVKLTQAVEEANH